MARPPSIFKALTWAYQQQIITYALTRSHGNVQQAARLLEVSVTTIERFMRLHAAEARQGGVDGHESVSSD